MHSFIRQNSAYIAIHGNKKMVKLYWGAASDL